MSHIATTPRLEMAEHFTTAGEPRSAWLGMTELYRRFSRFVLRIMGGSRVQTESWRLSADLHAAARARRLTRDQLIAWGLGHLSDTAMLLVSELVTNALRYTPGPISLTITRMDGVVRCEVADSGGEIPRCDTSENLTLEEEGGPWADAHRHPLQPVGRQDDRRGQGHVVRAEGGPAAVTVTPCRSSSARSAMWRSGFGS